MPRPRAGESPRDLRSARNEAGRSSWIPLNAVLALSTPRGGIGTSVDKDALESRKLELELQKAPLELQKLEAEVEELRSKLRIGPSRDALELRKLELELQKVPLEFKKLEGEVEELRSRLRVGPVSALLERLKVHSAYLTILATIGAGAFTIVQYLHQQEREQKFKVSQELIKLIDQINAKSEPVQRNAARALAYYGWQAAPILVENLAIARTDPVIQAIIESLRSIVGSEEQATGVKHLVRMLGESAEAFFRRELEEERPKVNMILGHIHALGLVGGDASFRGMLAKDSRERLERVLREARRAIDESKRESVTEKRAQLKAAIDDQLKRLSK